MSSSVTRYVLLGPAEHEVEIKRSRFVACALPLDAAEGVDHALALLRDAEATHNAWAWRFEQLARSHDDGEVSGTAGRPIAAALEGQGVDRVLVVVRRYYGGIKLGTGGLVRAYGGCAAECLRRAAKSELRLRVRRWVRVAFAQVAPLRALIGRRAAGVCEERYEVDGVDLLIEFDRDGEAALLAALRDLTRGQLRVAE